MTVLLLLAVLVLVLLNGFFVAAEFALVRVRRSRIEEEVEEGSWLVVEGTDADAVDPDPVGMWRRVLARQGGRLAWMAHFPPDVALN